MKEPKKKEMQSEDELEDSVLEALQKDIVELKKQNDEYLDSLQRERASFANYKRRIDQDNADLQDRALADNVKVFLPVVDDMERALNHQPDELTVSQWVEGLQLILQKLLKLLEAKGVRPIAIQPGDDFDPMEQEAVSYEDNPDYTDNQIIESVETGYKIKDKIIRPAKVRVAK
ncbi:MAG: nucleotide exchange factor GrpE [Anaerolineaceae bacterium]